MSRFVTTTFSDGPDTSLELAFEEWVRPLAIGASWTHIRIGVLWQITATATTPGSGASGFAIGLCSGTAHPFGDAACTNFVGVYCNVGLGYQANSGNPYISFSGTNCMVPVKKIGSSVSTGSDLPDSVGIAMATTGGAARRTGLYVDITKGSPNYTVGIMGPLNTYMTTDFTLPNLKSGMTVNYGSQFIGGVSFSVGNSAQTIATSESSGSFDTIDVYSNYLNNPLEIQAVLVEKIS